MKLTKVAVTGMLIGFFFGATPLSAQTIVPRDAVSRALSLENVKVTPERITGVITNRTPHMIRDVELLIQYHWVWQNERNPGKDSPGRTAVVKLDGPVQPGASLPFDYTPSIALPERSDGRFMPEIDITAFTTVVPQQAR